MTFFYLIELAYGRLVFFSVFGIEEPGDEAAEKSCHIGN